MERERAPLERERYLVGTADDLSLFTNYLVLQVDAAPFKIAPVRARIRRDVEFARQLGYAIVRIGFPADEADKLESWVAREAVRLADANRRHRSATLQRLAFKPHQN